MPLMKKQRPDLEGSGSIRLFIWKSLAMFLALLLACVFAVANLVFNLRFGEWRSGAQLLFIIGIAALCVAIGGYISKRSSLGMDD